MPIPSQTSTLLHHCIPNFSLNSLHVNLSVTLTLDIHIIIVISFMKCQLVWLPSTSPVIMLPFIKSLLHVTNQYSTIKQNDTATITAVELTAQHTSTRHTATRNTHITKLINHDDRTYDNHKYSQTMKNKSKNVPRATDPCYWGAQVESSFSCLQIGFMILAVSWLMRTCATRSSRLEHEMPQPLTGHTKLPLTTADDVLCSTLDAAAAAAGVLAIVSVSRRRARNTAANARRCFVGNGMPWTRRWCITSPGYEAMQTPHPSKGHAIPGHLLTSWCPSFSSLSTSLWGSLSVGTMTVGGMLRSRPEECMTE